MRTMVPAPGCAVPVPIEYLPTRRSPEGSIGGSKVHLRGEPGSAELMSDRHGTWRTIRTARRLIAFDDLDQFGCFDAPGVRKVRVASSTRPTLLLPEELDESLALVVGHAQASRQSVAAGEARDARDAPEETSSASPALEHRRHEPARLA